MAPHSRGLRLPRLGQCLGLVVTYNTTSPLPHGREFSLPSAAFGRPYSRHRYCFLFLRLLRCFSSAGSPSQRECHPFRDDRRSHSAIPGSTAACASPGLIAACHGLPRLPSRAIPQAASSSALPMGVGDQPLPTSLPHRGSVLHPRLSSRVASPEVGQPIGENNQLEGEHGGPGGI